MARAVLTVWQRS